ncbi:glycosyltransferase [Actinoplanes awajinensis]|uniref:Glycosyl transferase n=1 Tax=Actinoplanes awajinensis subsp. mycoplanecinus TaxID=135947 RepID=A0A0X3VBZ2_9ACTN|nr:glycosyltransferase [Actinoplanes awajinensis]KUL42218.1 glycosyl transferase [Actinoplanes awajinensis subsp. mycoplanecinus]
MPASPLSSRTRVVVVGSGWHFLSGISYYTCRLSNALQERYDVGTILMRRLLPARLYPGRDRVGQPLSDLRYADDVRVFDGIDWWVVPSVRRATRFLREQQPDVLVLQWWTGAVLHSYLALALAARRLGIRVVVEFHEVQDTAELRHRWAARYVRAAIRPLLRRTAGVVVHSAYDRDALACAYDLAGVPAEIALHGPFDHHVVDTPRTPGPDGVCRLLYFGTIRPYKGLEDLIEAFGTLGPEYHLTVVGETWEGWTRPAELIASSPARDRITFVNRYVPDTEVNDYFAAADAVVLPYRRSSASGPLHIAMSHGLPVVVTSVGGLVEAAGPYPGTVFVPPAEPGELAAGIKSAAGLTGRRHADPSSWERTLDAYQRLFTRIGIDQESVTSSNQTAPLLSPDLR